MKSWLAKALLPAPNPGIGKEVLPEVELRNGTRVRLQALFSTADGGAGALLDPLPELGEKRKTDHGLAEILNVIE